MDAAANTGLDRSGPSYLIPIKGYFALTNVVLLCLLFPTISLFFYNQTTSFRDTQLERAINDQTHALEQRATQLLRTLSRSGSQAIAGYNFTFLNTLINRAVSSDGELLACQFFSANEHDAAAGIDLAEISMEAVFSSTPLKHNPEQIHPGERDSKLLSVHFAEYSPDIPEASPLLLAKAPVIMGGEVWGFVYAAFSLKQRNSLIEQYRQEWSGQMQQYRFFLLEVTGLLFALGVLAAVLFTRPMTRSIENLRNGVNRVAGGDLSHRIQFRRIDCREFFSLGKSFNTMTDNLRHSRQQLDEYAHTLEEKVEERTRDLKDAQKVLVNQAHEAGMAEMAVEVLHNIGNALTPAKVEAQLLAGQLHESHLRTALAQAFKPLPELIGAAENLPEDERERLQQIVTLLPETITQEYDQAIAGLTSISDKHHYIENIISLQMHYAHLHGSSEYITCNQVVKDSLKILDKQLQQVEVTTNLRSTAEIHQEESKLLQVLVNLIKNSSEALVDTEREQRKLHISSADQQEKVVITVTDNGCGFDGETKEKMFQFGYSSKSRGSGFGLHSCANYLIANNGSITASSDGVNKGATFVVRLPIAEAKG